MNDWFLSSRFAEFPELLFLDIFQWLQFVSCLLICFVLKVIFYIILGSIWSYKVFLGIFIDPDKIFNSKQCSKRAYNWYLNKGYKPVQAYSRKYIMLSCFQLHEYIDNGYSLFLHWFANKFLNQMRKIDHFFACKPDSFWGYLMMASLFKSSLWLCEFYSLLLFFSWILP